MAIFHLRFPRMKHEENSIRGARYADRHGYDKIDWDLQLTRDGVVVVTHWRRPMLRDGFFDTRYRLKRSTPIGEMTWWQVRHLKTHDGYRIRRIEQMLPVAARLGLVVVLEPKSRAFAAGWIWEHITETAQRCGARIEAYALRSHGGEQTMRVAASYGVKTRVIDR
jgi:glycerophosphoryl diester phosphodiesterase